MNIVIVDDHPLVRQGLTTVISSQGDMTLIGEASNAADAIILVTETNPEVVLIDLRLADADGLEVIKKCTEKGSLCKFIVLTSSVDREDFRRAGELDVDGYVLKEAFPEELVAAIRLVYRGRKYYDPAMIDLMMNKEPDSQVIQRLSFRERDVLITLSEGLNNKDIAKKLFIAENTVKKHISQILAKLELSDRTQAALYARDNSELLNF